MCNLLVKSIAFNNDTTHIIVPQDISQAEILTKSISDFLSKNNIKKFTNLDDYLYISPKPNCFGVEDLKYALAWVLIF